MCVVFYLRTVGGISGLDCALYCVNINENVSAVITDAVEHIQILGTPTEETWSGVTHLPGYKPHKLGFYRAQKLGLAFPRLYDVVEGESMASALLQVSKDRFDHKFSLELQIHQINSSSTL